MLNRYSQDIPVAAIYCRLSKEDLDKLKKEEENESESIQNQKLLLMDYAVQNGFIIHKVYIDEDYSGFSERPDFKQMIKDAEIGLFNIILCKHQSRFTRDMELVEKYIHGLFIEWGIRFISLTDNIDTNIKGNKKARQINGLINEWYSEDLSENIRTVFKRKMQDGQFLGSFACYGYEKDSKDNHKIIADEEAAGVVKEIFSLYLEGYGASRISTMLTERGIPTPSQYKKDKGLNFANPNGGKYSEKYGMWAVNTVKRILRNKTYIGTLIQGRERKLSYKSKKVIIAPENEWIVIENNHEPIIDEKTFYTVQKLIDNKRTGYGIGENDNPEKSKPHLLAGRMMCLDCGAAMQRSGKSRDGKTHYIRCKVAAGTKRRDCTPHCISQERIENIVKMRIQAIINGTMTDKDGSEVVNEVCRQLNSTKELRSKKQKQLAEVEAKIKAIQKNITLTYTDKLNGDISEAEYLNFKEAFEEEKQAFISRKEYFEKELADYELQLRTHGNINTLLEKYKSIDVLTHEVINDFISTIQIGEKDSSANEQEIIINWLF